MHIEDIHKLCSSLPAVTEDIKWEHDLCFCVGGKMFLVVGLNSTPTMASFKVADEEFEEIAARDGFMPAQYVARYKWVTVDDINRMRKSEWKHYIQQSYQLVSAKLAKKMKKELGIE
ncbi:MAG TPA: MmcQ/YjbR family DNA-binding protein [Saprospiraceae bacterium]|nr:MmcQ/YjbR family DNA-binding protein [Saprospiraceae bacterium]